MQFVNGSSKAEIPEKDKAGKLMFEVLLISISLRKLEMTV
jgi:hypothetical protein